MDLKSLVTGDDTLLIEPPRASLGELQLTNRLEMIRVDHDVLGVAESLKRIDLGLTLLYDKKQDVYVLYWVGFKKGTDQMVEELVGAYKELDQRIVRLIERLDAQGRGRYDLQAELDKLERQKDRENDAAHHEKVGDAAERLRHALRVDLGVAGSSVTVGGSSGIQKARKETAARPKRRRR